MGKRKNPKNSQENKLMYEVAHACKLNLLLDLDKIFKGIPGIITYANLLTLPVLFMIQI